MSEFEPVPREALRADEIETTAIAHNYVSDSDMPQRMARSLFKFTILQPRFFFLLLGIVAVLTGLGLLSAQENYSTGIGFWIGIAIACVMVVIAVLNARRSITKRVDAIAKAGFVYGSGFGTLTMAFRTPMSTSEVLYRAYQEAVVRDGFVYLRARNSRLYTILPLELFPDDTLTVVRARIASA